MVNKESVKATPLSKGFGQAIQHFRAATSLDQGELAKKVKIEKVVLEAMEQGEYKWTVIDLEKLATALGLYGYQIVCLGETFAMKAEQKSNKRWKRL
jgi:ribosome-binding protein aMBF1 (putative translation factor)